MSKGKTKERRMPDNKSYSKTKEVHFGSRLFSNLKYYISNEFIDNLAHNYKYIILGSILLMFICCYLFIIPNYFCGFGEAEGWIGDAIGGMTSPIIGLVTTFLLIYTLRKQTVQNNRINKETKIEQFHTLFFELAKTQRELYMEIGSEVFAEYCKSLSEIFLLLEQRYIKSNSECHMLEECFNIYKLARSYGITKELYDKYQTEQDERTRIKIAYELLYKKYANLHHYMRHLYWILKMLRENRTLLLNDESSSVKINAQMLADILQAQRTDDELLLIFYDSIVFDKFRKVIVEFSFLENLDSRRLIKQDTHNVFKYRLRDFSKIFKTEKARSKLSPAENIKKQVL